MASRKIKSKKNATNCLTSVTDYRSSSVIAPFRASKTFERSNNNKERLSNIKNQYRDSRNDKSFAK